MPVVQRAGLEDLATVRSLRLRAMADAPYAFGSTLEREAGLSDEQWRRRLSNGPWFVAWEKEEPVGMVASFTPDESPGCPQLVGMWVEPSRRGTGVAASLVQAVLDWAATAGASGVSLWVADGNDRARRFYQRMGFAPTGRRQALPSNPAVGEEEMKVAVR
ncbi:MAG TPA: GNAT family N-acetyltransferase [Acidimicrobiales bacterium]|nr:GNAT family N-acetyltransferase [Acidimicrobiales bacterium]